MRGSPRWPASLPLECGDLLTVPSGARVACRETRGSRAKHAVAVDMESAGVAAEAARARVPFVAVRVVVDGLDDALPPGAESWIDERGDRRMSAVLRAAVDARQWRALLTLAKRYRVASGALDRLARALAAPAHARRRGAALPAGS